MTAHATHLALAKKTSRASVRAIGMAGLLGAATVTAGWLLAAAVVMIGLAVGLKAGGFAALVVVWLVGGFAGVGLLWLASRVLARIGVAHPIRATLSGMIVTLGLFSVAAYSLPQGEDSSTVVGVVLGLGVAVAAFALVARWAHRVRALGVLATVGVVAFTVTTLASW